VQLQAASITIHADKLQDCARILARN